MMHEEPICMVYVRLIEYVCRDITEDSLKLSTNPSIPWLHSQLMSNRLIHHQIRDVSISNLAAKSLVQREMAYAYLMPSFLVTVRAAAELPVPIPNLCLTGKRDRALIINQSIISQACIEPQYRHKSHKAKSHHSHRVMWRQREREQGNNFRVAIHAANLFVLCISILIFVSYHRMI